VSYLVYLSALILQPTGREDQLNWKSVIAVTELGGLRERPYLGQFGNILLGNQVEPSSFRSSSINPAAVGIDIDQGWLDALHVKVATVRLMDAIQTPSLKCPKTTKARSSAAPAAAAPNMDGSAAIIAAAVATSGAWPIASPLAPIDKLANTIQDRNRQTYGVAAYRAASFRCRRAPGCPSCATSSTASQLTGLKQFSAGTLSQTPSHRRRAVPGASATHDCQTRLASFWIEAARQ
jgi:hypothetical protein